MRSARGEGDPEMTIDKLLEYIVNGQAGVAVILAFAWWKEWREKQSIMARSSDALKGVESALQSISEGIALIKDRVER